MQCGRSKVVSPVIWKRRPNDRPPRNHVSFFDKAARWERALVLLACGVLAFCQWFPMFRVLDATGFGDWQLIQHNWEAAYISIARFGEWPLWDPFHCGGISIFRNPESQVFSPFFPLSFAFGTVIAVKIMVWAHVAIGLYGAYRLARDAYRLDVLPSATAAFVWACSGCIAWDGAGGHATFLPFLFTPWVPWLVRTERPATAATAWLALLFVVTLFEGGTYPLPFFALLLAFELGARAIRERSLRTPLGIGAGVLALTAAAGAIRIVPSVLALREFPRQVPNNDAVSLREVLVMLTARDHPWRVPGHPFVWAEYGSYVGWSVVIVAALGAAWVAWRGPRDLLAGNVVFAAFMLGNHGPYAPWSLLHELPVYDSLRVPTRFAMFVTLYLGLLAAHALQAALSSTRWPRLVLIPLTLMAAAQLADTLIVTRPIIALWRNPPLDPSPPAKNFHLVGTGYGRRYASFPRLNLGSPHCYAGAMNWDVSKALWLDDQSQVRVREGRGIVHQARRSSSRWWIDVELETNGRLWVNQNYADGWNADVGHLVRDRGLLALDLPAGRHLVQLRYAPRELLPCALVSAAGLALIGLVGRRRTRR